MWAIVLQQEEIKGDGPTTVTTRSWSIVSPKQRLINRTTSKCILFVLYPFILCLGLGESG
jgi:hypothetical protein